MNKLIALGVVTLAGVIVLRSLPRELRPRPAAAVRRWIAKHMEQMMLKLSRKRSAETHHVHSAKTAGPKRRNNRYVA